MTLPAWPRLLYAQDAKPGEGEKVDVVCDPKIPEHCTAILVEGDTAPFSGVLYSPALSAEISSDSDYFDRRLALEVKFEKMKCKMLTKREADLRQIEVDSCAAKEAILNQAIDDAVSWYRRPVFVAVAAVLATVGMVAVTAYALKGMEAR